MTQEMLTNPSLIIQNNRSEGLTHIPLRAQHSEDISLNEHHQTGLKKGAVSQNASSFNQTQTNKLNSPTNMNADGELTRMMQETDNNGFFNMSQVLATSDQQGHRKQRSSKTRKKASDSGKLQTRTRQGQPLSGEQSIPFPQHQDQYSNYNLSGQIFHPIPAHNNTQQNFNPQMMPPSFISTQNKFYQVSPQREPHQQVPILFDKRPYTSSGTQQVMSKRSSANKVQSSAIAALYLASSTKQYSQTVYNQTKLPNSNEILALANSQVQNQLISSQQTQPSKNKKAQSQTRKSNLPQYAQMDHETLFDEATKLKQHQYDLKDEVHRLKTKLKISETELHKRDKQMNDMFDNTNKHSQSVNKDTTLAIRKQVKWLKSELKKRDDFIVQLQNDNELITSQSHCVDLKNISQIRQSVDNLYQPDSSKILEGKDDMIRQLTEQLQQVVLQCQQDQASIQEYEEMLQHQQEEFQQCVDQFGQESAQKIQQLESEVEIERNNVLRIIQEHKQEVQRVVQELQVAQSQVKEIEGTLSQENLKNQGLEEKLVNMSKDKSTIGEVTDLKNELESLQKEMTKKLEEKDSLLDILKDKEQLYEMKIKEFEQLVKGLTLQSQQAQDKLKIKGDLTQSQEQSIQDLEKKVKSLKDTLHEISQSPESYKPTDKVLKELYQMAPILAINYRIKDRLTLVQELKLGIQVFTPSEPAQEYLQKALVHEIALLLPSLQVPKFDLNSYSGEVGQKVEANFDECQIDGEPLSEPQKQYLMGKYLTEIIESKIYINTAMLQSDLSKPKSHDRRKHSVDEEQMLDIAEMQFVRIADLLIQKVITVKECFSSKYSIQETLPESKAQLDLLPPSQFLKALEVELGITDLTDLEIACLMRVLAKPELGNAIIVNEFALIMENFGVPLVDGTISDDEEYIPEGMEKPKGYDLSRIDDDGIEIMQEVAKFLLKEYMHPREFFGKSVKNNQEIKQGPRVFRVDTLNIKDFYLKIKIASIRKVLKENQSLNQELCVDAILHPGVFNMKTFIRALEDIAEIEQEKLYNREKQSEELKDDQPASPESPVKDKLPQEVVKFTKGMKTAISPVCGPTKFTHLGTIDETMNETVTSQQITGSQRDNDSKLDLRHSKMNVDFEDSVTQSYHRISSQKVEIMDVGVGSLSVRRDNTRNSKLPLGQSVDNLNKDCDWSGKSQIQLVNDDHPEDDYDDDQNYSDHETPLNADEEDQDVIEQQLQHERKSVVGELDQEIVDQIDENIEDLDVDISYEDGFDQE